MLPRKSLSKVKYNLLIKVTGMFSLLPTKHPIGLISHTIDFIFNFFNSDTTTGAVWLCLGSVFLCLGTSSKQKNNENDDDSNL